MTGAARSVAEDEACKAERRKRIDIEDAAIMRAMLLRGDRIVDVAYWFGVSPSTVHKIKRQKLSSPVTFSALELPPRGPYMLVARSTFDAVQAERDAAAAVCQELEKILGRYRLKCEEAVTDPRHATT